MSQNLSPITRLHRPVLTHGIGVHTGARSSVKISPAPSGSGIVFERSKTRVAALSQNITSTLGATEVGLKETRIRTIEHLMAAFSGLGIRDALVQVDGPELPIFDGSALPWVRLLQRSGLLRALEKSKSFSLRKPLCFQQAHRVALLEPAEQISWYVPGARFEARHMSFEREIAPARTFAQKADIEAMQAMGLLKGIHEGCGVLMEQNRAVNTNLRFNNECARHKLLDAMGDFALLGAPLLARIYIVNGSHSFHRLVLSQVVRSIDAHSSNRDC